MAGKVTGAKLELSIVAVGAEKADNTLGRIEKHIVALNKSLDAMNKAFAKFGGSAGGIEKVTSALKAQEAQAKKTGQAIAGAAGAASPGAPGLSPSSAFRGRGRPPMGPSRGPRTIIEPATILDQATMSGLMPPFMTQAGMRSFTSFDPGTMSWPRTMDWPMPGTQSWPAGPTRSWPGGSTGGAARSRSLPPPFQSSAALLSGQFSGAVASGLAKQAALAQARVLARQQGTPVGFGAPLSVPGSAASIAAGSAGVSQSPSAVSAAILNAVSLASSGGGAGAGPPGPSILGSAAGGGGTPSFARPAPHFQPIPQRPIYARPAPHVQPLPQPVFYPQPPAHYQPIPPAPGQPGGPQLSFGRQLQRGIMRGPAGVARALMSESSPLSGPWGWGIAGAYLGYRAVSRSIDRGYAAGAEYEGFLKDTQGLVRWSRPWADPANTRAIIDSQVGNWSGVTGLGLGQTRAVMEEAQGASSRFTGEPGANALWEAATLAHANLGISPGVVGHLDRALAEGDARLGRGRTTLRRGQNPYVIPRGLYDPIRSHVSALAAGFSLYGLGGPRLPVAFSEWERGMDAGNEIGAAPMLHGLTSSMSTVWNGFRQPRPSQTLRIAGGMQRSMLDLSRAGALQSPFDIVSLVSLGGLNWNKKGGFGMQDVEDAQRQLEKGELTPDMLRAFAGTANQMGGGGAGGRAMMRLFFEKRGVPISPDLAGGLQGWLQSGAAANDPAAREAQMMWDKTLKGATLGRDFNLAHPLSRREAEREYKNVLVTGREASEARATREDATTALDHTITHGLMPLIKPWNDLLERIATSLESLATSGGGSGMSGGFLQQLMWLYGVPGA